MAYVPLILALLVLATVCAGVLLAEFAAWRVRIARHFRHDLSNTICAARLAHNLGRDRDVNDLLSTIAAYLDPDVVATIKLRKFVRSIVSLVEYSVGPIFDVDDPRDIKTTVIPVEAHRAILNVLINAAEAREQSGSSELIRVLVRRRCVIVKNRACKADRRAIVNGERTTRKGNRGTGRASIVRSCDRLNWRCNWQVRGSWVVATLYWQHEQCYPMSEENSGVNDAQRREDDLN